MSKHLSASSSGVAHHSPGRTLLKVPKKFRSTEKLKHVKKSLEKLPGVSNVEVNLQTGSILLHHDHGAQIFELVGGALKDAAADLLTALIEEETGVAEVGIAVAGISTVGGYLKGLFKESGNGNGAGKLPEVHLSDAKNLLPLAFIGTGIYQALVAESLLAGVSPLVFLYWGFDSYWKLNMEFRNQIAVKPRLTGKNPDSPELTL